MKDENKIPMDEVHERLNARAGEEVSEHNFESLLICWKRKMHYKNRGDDGWLRESDVESFLKYAY